MSKFDPAVTLPQTIDFITEAQTLVAGISLEQLLADPIKLRAFERVMELVGESVKRVPQDFRDTHEQIPWKKIAGNGSLVIEVEYDMREGLPTPFVVRLIGKVNGAKACISRYDSAHLQEPPHRDLLGLQQGNRGKFFYETLDYADVIAYAILDFKKNGHEYYKDFIKN